MVPSPLDLFQQVSEVSSDGDVVLPGNQLLVEMLIVDGILLQHNAVACQQVRQSIRSHCAVYVYLVLVLGVDTRVEDTFKKSLSEIIHYFTIKSEITLP